MPKCEGSLETFRPDPKLLKLMPDETLLETQWKVYGACSGVSQTRYFDRLSQIYKSVRIPKEFISPNDHFEISVEQARKEVLQASSAPPPTAVYIFCRSGFLSKIQIQKDSRIAKPAGSCDDTQIKVIAKMPLAE